MAMVKNHLVIPAKAGIQVVYPCEASEITSFGSCYELGSSFESSRFAACLLTPLRWNDEMVIDPYEN
jgi:hypothetical protein